MSFPKALFNLTDLTVKVGNKIKGYEILPVLKVPTFKRIVLERESLGNGWYGSKEKVEKIYDRYYIIMKEGNPYGILSEPYIHDNIKSDILPLNGVSYIEVNQFILDILNK